MIRSLIYMVFALVWATTGVLLVVLGALLLYLLQSCTDPACIDLGGFLQREVLLGRVPTDISDVLLLTLIGGCFVLGTWGLTVSAQALQLVLARRQPAQASLMVSFGVTVVLLVLALDAFVVRYLQPVYERTLVSELCPDSIPVDVPPAFDDLLTNLRAQTPPAQQATSAVCVQPPAQAQHPFYQVAGAIPLWRSGYLLFAALNALLALAALAEPASAPPALRKQYRSGGLQCAQCGIHAIGETLPECSLCQRYLQTQNIALHLAEQPAAFAPGDVVRLQVAIQASEQTSLRNLAITLTLPDALAYDTHDNDAWQAQTLRDSLRLQGPALILAPEALQISLRVPERPRQLRRYVQHTLQIALASADITDPLRYELRVPVRTSRTAFSARLHWLWGILWRVGLVLLVLAVLMLAVLVITNNLPGGLL